MDDTTAAGPAAARSEPTVREVLANQLDELIGLADEVRRNALDAIQLMGDDRLQDSCDTLSLTHYPAAQALAACRGALNTFRALGYRPGEVRDQSIDDRATTGATLAGESHLA